MARQFRSAGLARSGYATAQTLQFQEDATLTTAAPGQEAPATEWASYVNEARGRAVESIIEWGNRIRLAHDAYRAQGQSWGRTWEDWCQQNLGVGRSMVSRLETIAENLLIGNQQILPPNTDSLYALARVRRDAPGVFEARLAAGDIHPEMTREEVRTILVQAIPVTPKPQSSPPRRSRSLSLDPDLLTRLEAIAREQGLTVPKLLDEAVTFWCNHHRS